MILVTLTIFLTWIWVAVDIDKFLIDLGLETFSVQNYMVWEHANVWLAVCLVALQ
jgi:hypothetical protein